MLFIAENPLITASNKNSHDEILSPPEFVGMSRRFIMLNNAVIIPPNAVAQARYTNILCMYCLKTVPREIKHKAHMIVQTNISVNNIVGLPKGIKRTAIE